MVINMYAVNGQTSGVLPLAVARLNWAIPTSSANFNNFDRALYLKTGSMPLRPPKIVCVSTTNIQHFG